MRRIKFIALAITLFVCFISCGSKKEIRAGDTAGPLLPNARKAAFTGSFIDFWRKENWTQKNWDDQFKEMKGLGMNTVIIQFLSYENDSSGTTLTWFNSNNDFSTSIHRNALQPFMEAAATNNMDVHFGLYFSDQYWRNQTNIEWLKLHAERCKFIAKEIYDQYKNHPSFKGWYIPHEPEPYAYNSVEKTSIFRENFVDNISNYLHQLNDKPVSIAAFFNNQLSSPQQYGQFMQELGKSNLQVIMLQDGVGVEHVSLTDLEAYYQASVDALYKKGNFKGDFWADVEIFQLNNTPADMQRIERQIKAALPYVHKLVSFQHYKHMSWYSSQSDLSRPLLKDYQQYLQQQEK